jgi:DNA-binding SARP family transcriptional activator
MDFRILGPLEVWDGERQVELGGPKRRAVLALLLLHANDVIGVDRLTDQLWGEKAPRNATAALHTHVSRLRKELGPEIVARRDWGYVLLAEPGVIDLERFERLIADSESLPAGERAARLREALALWRGRPLEDLAFEPALARDIARLDELHLVVLETRIDADLEAGTYAGLVGELETLVAAHPLRERLRGQLIRALYRSGRQAEALEVYRDTRRVLAEELGLEPSPELRELERAILQQDPALLGGPGRREAVAGTGTRPVRRRRIFVGASVALLLAGLGAAAAYALSTRTTPVAQRQSTSLPSDRKSTAAHTTTAREATTTAANTTTTTRNGHHGGKKPGKPSKSSVTGGVASAAPVRPATTGSSHHAAPPPLKPVTISDAFGSGHIDTGTWNEVRNGGDVSLVEQGGQLQLMVGADAVPGGPYNRIDVHVETLCSFPGNFDARVDYTLPPEEWPVGDNIDVGMYAAYGVAGVMRDSSSSSQAGDGYASWVGEKSASAPYSDSTGTLRINRVSGLETTYIWHEGQWQRLAFARETGPAAIGLQAVSDGQNPFGGVELKAAFDNFKVTGMKPHCPPGARAGHN